MEPLGGSLSAIESLSLDSWEVSQGSFKAYKGVGHRVSCLGFRVLEGFWGVGRGVGYQCLGFRVYSL